MSKDTSVRFIRMQTGEDLIAEVTEVKSDDEWYYVLHNPLKIIYTVSDRPGILSVAMMEWIFSKVVNNTSFPVYPNDIITMVEPSIEFEEYYLETLDNLEKIRERQNANMEFSSSKEGLSQYDEDEEQVFDVDRLKQIIDTLKNSANTASPDKKRKLH